jgi:hypothetical protein
LERRITLEAFPHEYAGHFSANLEGVLSKSQFFEAHRLIEKHCANRSVYVDRFRTVLSRRALGSCEQGRTNSTPGKITVDVDRCAMLAFYEGVGGKTCNTFIFSTS